MSHATTSNHFSLKVIVAFALVISAVCFANPLSAQPPPGSTVCFECVDGCESGDGGWACDWAGPGRIRSWPHGRLWTRSHGATCFPPMGFSTLRREGTT